MKVNNSNSFWVKFDEFGFYYRVKGGVLKQAPIQDNGEIDSDKKILVKYIDTNLQELNILEKINYEFGTNFKYTDFNI